jgi:osmotically-inducible protein OsmY
MSVQETAKAKIEETLRRNAVLGARRIRVEIDAGTVKLHANVRSWAEKEEVEDAAWSAPGTAKVVSHLTVEP